MNTPRRILVIRLSSMGDIVLTTPVLRVLRNAFPSAQIDFLLKRKFADLLEPHPDVDRVLAVPDRPSIRELLGIAREVRRSGYDWIVDLHRNPRSAVLTTASGGSQVLRYTKGAFNRLLFVRFRKPADYMAPPVASRYLAALGPVGIEDDGDGLGLRVAPMARSRVDALLPAEGVPAGAMLVVLAPGAGHFTKRWPPERFGRLGRRLVDERNARLVILGGAEDEEAGETIAEEAGERATNLCGRLSLGESVAAVERSDLVIGNDTGLIHVAAALGRPHVAIFGSTTRHLGFFPFRAKAEVVENPELACRPCSHLGKRRCPLGHFECMLSISPDAVMQAVERLFGEGRETSAARVVWSD